MKAFAIQRKPHRGGKWEYDEPTWDNSEGNTYFRMDCRSLEKGHWKYRVVRVEITVVKEGSDEGK